MAEVSRLVIAIVLVLNAVFLPVAFLGGLVGEMVDSCDHDRGVRHDLRFRRTHAHARDVRGAAQDRRVGPRAYSRARQRVSATHAPWRA
jgi:hypothetical protein